MACVTWLSVEGSILPTSASGMEKTLNLGMSLGMSQLLSNVTSENREFGRLEDWIETKKRPGCKNRSRRVGLELG